MKTQDLQVGDKVKIVRCCSVECGHDCLGTIGTLKIIDSDSTILPYKVGRVWAHKVEKVGSRGRPKGSKNKPKKDYIVFDGGYYCTKHEVKNCPDCFSQGEPKPEIEVPKSPQVERSIYCLCLSAQLMVGSLVCLKCNKEVYRSQK